MPAQCFILFCRNILGNIFISMLISHLEKVRTAWLFPRRLKSERKWKNIPSIHYQVLSGVFKKSSNPTSDSENKSGEGSLHCALTKTSMAIVSLPLESIHRKPSHQVVWTELKQVSSKLKNIFKGLKQIILWVWNFKISFTRTFVPVLLVLSPMR